MDFKKITSFAAALSLCTCMLGGCTDGEAADMSSAVSSGAQESVSVTDSQAEESSSSAEESSSLAEDSSSQAEEDSSSESAAETDTDTSSQEENKEPSDITPAMWTVTSPSGETMICLGSMHALMDEDYPLPDRIMDAYNNADILAVECDTTESTGFFSQLSLLKQMVYNDGSTLQEHISPEAYSALDKYLGTYNMSADSLNMYKPWAASNTVESLSLLNSGLGTDNGIDYYFMELAHSENKEIYEVESVDFQMDLLMNFSDETYDLMFRSLEEETKESQTELLLDLYEAWKTGDIEEIERLNFESDTGDMTDEQIQILEDYENQMIYDRNITMETAIKDLLEENKNVFFIVGAAHYLGEGGIVDLLENDGYTVERIEY